MQALPLDRLCKAWKAVATGKAVSPTDLKGKVPHRTKGKVSHRTKKGTHGSNSRMWVRGETVRETPEVPLLVQHLSLLSSSSSSKVRCRGRGKGRAKGRAKGKAGKGKEELFHYQLGQTSQDLKELLLGLRQGRMQANNKDRASLMSCHHHPQDSQQPSSRATSAQDHALCIVHSRASSSRATSSRAINSRATSSRATSSRAVSSRAFSSKATSSRATSSKACSLRATSRGQWKDP